jgi:pyridoxine 5-phosphate synthase
MARLSVNINKIALIRNSRGANFPNLLEIAKDCESFGAEGITVHPRPDERHVRFDDIPQLKALITTEFNVEGNPTPDFMKLVLENSPHQCTLVPDAVQALTSDNGWDTIRHASFLKEVTAALQEKGIRVSIFVNSDPKMVEGAKALGAERIEFYTGPFAKDFTKNPERAIKEYVEAAKVANDIEIGINAGHDLNLHNLKFFNKNIPNLLEVSIGHALVVDALYYGLQNTIQMYKNCLSSH